MKKALFILGAVGLLIVGAIVLLAQYGLNKAELELNRQRTEKARQTRLENLRNGKSENPVEDAEILERQINEPQP